MLQWEKELIGLYIAKHPLAYLSDLFKEQVTHTTAEITEDMEKHKVVLGGTITEARRITTKKGDPMCAVKLEDMFGSIEVTVGDEIPRSRELIEVHVSELSLLFNAMDPSPAREKDLDPKAEEFIVGWARAARRDAQFALQVYVDRPGVPLQSHE